MVGPAPEQVAHIPDAEELDSARASAAHDALDTQAGTVAVGVAQDAAEEHEMPTRTEMQVANAHKLAEAQQQMRLDSTAPVVHIEIPQPQSQQQLQSQPLQPVQQQQQPQPQVALAHTGAQVQIQSQAQTQAGAGMGAGPGMRPKGWDQCLKFARNMKAQGVAGAELVRVWKTTCEPAVESGVATERYKLMCNSLGGAVEPFAAQHDYDVMQLCDAVLTVFHDVLAQ